MRPFGLPEQYEVLARRGEEGRFSQLYSRVDRNRSASHLCYYRLPSLEDEAFLDAVAPDVRHDITRPQEELLEELMIGASDAD